jgi:preprotein translocase subunit SecG
MLAVLLVIHLIVAIAIVAVVLIQPSESGGFMGNSGSMSNMMMPRRQADFMTRLTTILATCFFFTSMTLAVFASRGRAPETSILDVPTGTAVEQVAPVAEEPATPKAPISKQ